MYDAERYLVSHIADRVLYWMLHGDVQLQILAVKICCNLSLVESHRSAIAETGIFDSVFGKFSSLCLGISLSCQFGIKYICITWHVKVALLTLQNKLKQYWFQTTSLVTVCCYIRVTTCGFVSY